MCKSKNNGTNFLVQGSILAVASIISRIIGLVYRIPLNNILGDVGISYYACAFDVYNVILIISSYSLPQAVSKTVSAKAAKGQYRSVYQVLKGALLFALVSGIVASLVVFFGAEFFTGTLLKTPYSVFALKILGPALVVVAVLGVLRGFFQGLGTMMPSAISQIIEQIVNAIISVWAAYVLYRYGTKIGAVLGDADHYGPAYGAAGGTLGLFPLSHFFLQFAKFRLQKVCRTACDDLRIADALLLNFFVERFCGCTVFTGEDIFCLFGYHLVTFTHDHVKYSLCTNDL